MTRRASTTVASPDLIRYKVRMLRARSLDLADGYAWLLNIFQSAGSLKERGELNRGGARTGDSDPTGAAAQELSPYRKDASASGRARQDLQPKLVAIAAEVDRALAAIERAQNTVASGDKRIDIGASDEMRGSKPVQATKIDTAEAFHSPDEFEAALKAKERREDRGEGWGAG